MKRKTTKKAKMKNKTLYKKGYRYQLHKMRQIQTPHRPKEKIKKRFFELDRDGLLTIRKGYSWDGRSGLIRRKKTKTPSLYHDCIYQMIRMELLPATEKDTADAHYETMLRDRGVFGWYAAFDRKMLQIFGGKAASPDNRKVVYSAP